MPICKPLIVKSISVMLLLCVNQLGAANWPVTQLTDNNYNDSYPQISGSNVVWYGSDGNDTEIFLYDGTSTTQLTSNNYNDHFPKVSGPNVAWMMNDGTDSEVFYYDGTSTTQLTNNNYNDGSYSRDSPCISGSNVVWYSQRHPDRNLQEIFLYDGISTTQLTNDDYADYYPQVSGSNVAWIGGEGSQEVFLYDGTSTTQLTSYTPNNTNVRISGSNVVWLQYVALNHQKVFLYDGTSTTELADGSVWDPQISGSNVVWSGGGADMGIWFHDGSAATKIADSGNYPQISGSNVVWSDYGIWFYDGTIATKIADEGSFPQISGSTVVWYGSDGNDSEIFMAVIPEPAVLSLLALGSVVLVRRWW